MDRRGHGASGDSPHYSLQREAEDVAAVVNSRPGTVFLLGHSYGGVCALEAAFLTDKISKLVLYEPPLHDLDHSAVVDRMERMIQKGDREQALVTFLQEIVMISPSEIAAMKARPSWPGLLASIESSIRQARALAAYRFDPKRMSTMNVPTLLLTGSETASPQLKQAISGLLDSLPNRSLFVFEGQQHNAMDTVPQQFAEAVGSFLLVLPAMHCFIRTASSLNMFPLVAQIPNSSPSLRRFLGLCLAHGALGSNPHSHLARLLTSEIGPDPIVRLRELIGL